MQQEQACVLLEGETEKQNDNEQEAASKAALEQELCLAEETEKKDWSSLSRAALFLSLHLSFCLDQLLA